MINMTEIEEDDIECLMEIKVPEGHKAIQITQHHYRNVCAFDDLEKTVINPGEIKTVPIIHDHVLVVERLQ